MKFVLSFLILGFVFSGCSPSESGYYHAPTYTFIPQAAPVEDPSTKTEKDAAEQADESNDWNAPMLGYLPAYEGELGFAAQNFFATQFVSCRGSCKEGIGLLLSAHLDRHVSSCTTFLISNNVVMTDSHCIPSDLKAPGSPAVGRLQVKFPPYNSVSEVEYTIFTSPLDDENSYNPDYAFLLLKQSAFTQPLKISRSGFKDNVPVTFWRVGPGENGQVLSSVTCRSIQNTALFPEFKKDRSPLAALADCAIVEGNSGGPGFNDKGEVIGVLKAYFKIEKTQIGQIMKPEIISQFPRVALATNLACIKDFGHPNRQLSEDCNEDLSAKAYFAQFGRRYGEVLAQAGSDVDAQVQSKIMNWQISNTKIFRWKFKASETHTRVEAIDSHPSFFPLVDCVQPASSWIEDYKTYLFFYKSKAEISGELSSFGPGVGADANLDLFPQASEWKLGKYKITFDPSEIKKTGIGHITLTQTLEMFGKSLPISLPFTVKTCD